MVYKDSIVYNNEGFEEAYLQRQLSANNMIKSIDGSSWSYTYNEYGQPATKEGGIFQRGRVYQS